MNMDRINTNAKTDLSGETFRALPLALFYIMYAAQRGTSQGHAVQGLN
jgi:hypothetical protein